MERDEDGYDMFCDYHLVLELEELDIRGEVYGDDHELLRREREKRVELGGTKTTRRRHLISFERGEIDLPFRDCGHIQWDAKRLGLPAFVVWGEWAMDVLAWRKRKAAERGEAYP